MLASGGAGAGGRPSCSQAQLAAGSAQVEASCCAGGNCAGVPSSCSAECAAVFMPWWESCSVTLASADGGAGGLRAFADLCASPGGGSKPSSAGEDIGAGLWQTVLSLCLRPGTSVDGMEINAFDYSQLTSGNSAARAAFDQYIDFLATLPSGAVDAFSPPARKALLINAYNAFAVKVIVDRFVFSGMFAMQSIKDVGDVFAPVWTSVAGSLAGQDVSLDDVEKGQGAPLLGLLPSYHDPRIHSSVICASVSCPDLSPTAFTAANEDELLNARVSAWLAHPTKGLAVADDQITASKIFDCKAAILPRLVAPSTSLT